MRLHFNVEYVDGTKADVDAVPAGQVAYEDAFDRSIQRLFDDLRLKDIAWLSWRALTRTGATSAPFDEWLATVENVGLGKAEDPAPLEETTPSTGE